MYYYCTCTRNGGKKREVENGRTPFRKVQVDDEGICLDCGYYAVSYPENIDPEGGKLYNKLMGDLSIGGTFKNEVLGDVVVTKKLTKKGA